MTTPAEVDAAHIASRDRVARPEEIAEAVWVSGTIVDLNGASYLRI